MNAFFNLLGKFSGGAEQPLIRMKGVRRSKRYLLMHFPASDECTVRTVPFLRLSDVSFAISKKAGQEQWALYMNENTLVADVGSEEEAREVIRRIAIAIAPSKWRWVRRLFVLWLLYMLFMPAPVQRAPRAPIGGAPMQMMPAPEGLPGMPVGLAAPAAPPAILQSVQGAPAATPGQVPAQAQTQAPAENQDPFGLQVVPQAKQ